MQEANQETSNATRKQLYKAYTIIEKPGEQKNVWLDIGIASVNKDNSINCTLNAMPLDGKVQLRLYDPQSRNQVNNSSPKSWQREGF